jgi:hypothetical protein
VLNASTRWASPLLKSLSKVESSSLRSTNLTIMIVRIMNLQYTNVAKDLLQHEKTHDSDPVS